MSHAKEFRKYFSSVGGRFDAFGRQRVSDPKTLFDSKQLGDNRPIFWDDQEVSGSGTGSSYDSDRASTTISVSDATAGKRVRQTKQRFNYQPGKSLEVFFTNVVGAGSSGITKRWGYFDDNNGVFFEQEGTTLKTVVRSNTTGTPVDMAISSNNWSIDRMNGKGPSDIDINVSNAQIWLIDIEWLGVGSVRFGCVIDGAIYYIDQRNHANIIDSVYMSTPNLPVRCEIENDGTGGAASVEQICCTVISEGGVEETGIIRATSTGANHVDLNTADQLYALIGIRLKTTHLDNVVQLKKVNVIAETNDDFEWQLLLNPTVAGTFTYADETNSAVQSVIGSNTNTVTGGTFLDGGHGKAGSVVATLVESLYYLGSTIDGTRDEIVLCVRPMGANADFRGTIIRQETA